MRDPKNIQQVDYNGEDSITIVMDEIPEYNLIDFDLQDEKQFKKYIDSIERDVRGSFEYKAYINYLREYLNMNACSFYSNVNNIDTTKIKIEIHHEPITLYDICIIVYNKRSCYRESLEEEMVAKEVMYLHYCLLVGLIPVSETVHELIHNQYIFVPTDRVLGKYREFVEMYKDFMMPEQLEVLERIEEATRAYNDDYQSLLSRNYIYLDMSGAYDLPKTEDIIQAMKNRITDIRNKTNTNLIKPAYFVEKKYIYKK